MPTDERRGDDELHRRLRQQAAVADLGRSALAGGDFSALLGAVAERVAAELGSPYVALLEALGEPGEFLVRAGHSPSGGGAVRGEPIRLSGMGGQATFTLAQRAPVIAADLAAESRFAVEHPLALGLASSVSVAIGAPDRPFGVIAAYAASKGGFSSHDVDFLQSVANTVAAAAARARAEDGLREALARASESERRFRELADSAPVFIYTTDRDGMVDFMNRGWLEFTGHSLEQELGDTWTLGVHPDDAGDVGDSWRRAFARRGRWEREYRLRRADGEYRWIIDRAEPRHLDGEFLGYVGTATDIHERKVYEQRLSIAYERDHRVAETLQRSLLPERLPAIDGVELAARYLPAARGSAIGGDWYDALELDDGRVALVVGDVVGHGLLAAAAMGELRNAFRAYALVESSPAALLERLDALMAASARDTMATVLAVVLDRDTGDITYAGAGHPPPLVVDAGGPRYLEGGRSLPLGAGGAGPRRDAEARLGPGAMLLLYTDGLVERRDAPIDRGLAELSAVAGEARGELGGVCDAVIAAVLGGSRPADDVALLAVRSPAPVGERLTMRLQAAPAVLPRVRRRLERFLAALEASEAERFEITLTACEAVANTIEHAYGGAAEPFCVELAVEREGVTVTVRDRGSWRPERGGEQTERGRGLAIMRGLMDEVEVSRPADGGTLVRMHRRLRRDAAA